MNPANVAAQVMEHLCACPEHGYSQPGRYGTPGAGDCAVETEAGTLYVRKGDRDCSSAVCEAWRKALSMTEHADALDGATYTGNMRRAFEGSGLFEWRGMDFTAQRGDVYLNERDHTAMCLDSGNGDGPYGYDCLGEFSLAETGGIDGDPGDQTDGESSIHGYYDFPWDGILHYVGPMGGECHSEPQEATQEAAWPPLPRYRVKTREDGWLDWMRGLECTGGSGDDFAGIPGHVVIDFQAEGLGPEGWYTIQRAANGDVVGITVYYDTDLRLTGGRYFAASYQVHWLGAFPGWGKWEVDDEDGGAGMDDRSPLDMVRLTLKPND